MMRTRHSPDKARRPLLARVRKIAPLLLTGAAIGDRVRSVIEGPPGPYTYRVSLPVQLYANLCVWIDQRVAWHKLPVPLALVVMIGDRIKLRQENLHDTGGFPTLPQPEPQAKGTEYLRQRMADPGERQPEQVKGRQLGGESLGGSNADLRSRMGIQDAIGLSRRHASHGIAN